MKVRKMLNNDNRGIGVIEIILILVIILGLIIIFKSQIEAVVTTAFDAITNNTDKIIGS